jgi:hypothetical protein
MFHKRVRILNTYHQKCHTACDSKIAIVAKSRLMVDMLGDEDGISDNSIP